MAIGEEGGLVTVYDVVDFGRRGRLAVRERHELLHSDGMAVRSVCFSADGKKIVSCGDDRIVRIWSMETGRLWRSIKRHDPSPLTAEVFSTDGTKVITATGNGTIEFWNAEDGTQVATVGSGKGPPLGLAISSDGRLLVTYDGEGGVGLWLLNLATAAAATGATES